MSDHFEKAKDDILKRTAGNGGPSNLDLLEALQALALDDDEKHEETTSTILLVSAKTAKVADDLAIHCADAVTYFEKTAALESWRSETGKTCEKRVRTLIKEEHDEHHAAYIASLGESDFRGRLVWFFATTLGKFSLVVLGVAAGIVLNLMVYGRP